MADLHLLNEASDRYNKVIPNIKEALVRLNVYNEIEAVDILGDIIDCEYVTYKRITYFSAVMDLISEHLSEKKRLLIGNHDKFFKNDQHDENILRYIKHDGDLIDSPTIIDRMLYIPHYYNKENFPAGLLDPNDFDVVIGHLGLEFTNDVEELTLEDIQKFYKGKTIISGHIHNMNLNFDSKAFLLGTIKSESHKEQSPVYSVCVLDGVSPRFIVFPYHKIHLTINVQDEDQFRDTLFDMFKTIHQHNSSYHLYNSYGDVEDKSPCDRYITSIINIKLRVFNKDIKKRDIDLIIEYCRHEIDDPAFMAVAVKTIYQIENPECADVICANQEAMKVDKAAFTEQKRIITDFMEDIKSGERLINLGKNRKFMKVVENVTEGEMERFAEFLLISKKEKEFFELLKMID
jgi:hypothetical protein